MPSTSATASTRSRRFTGSRHVTDNRGAVSTGRPRLRLVSVIGDESLVDSKLKPHVLESAVQGIIDYVDTIARGAEERRRVGKGKLLELEPVRVAPELILRKPEEPLFGAIELAEVDAHS
jgi:hypothetical protein